MDDIQFEGMTAELRAYLEFKGEGNDVYQERKRLRSLIQPGLLLAYYRASKERFFIPENEDVNSRSEKLSPTGKYKLRHHSISNKTQLLVVLTRKSNRGAIR